MSLTDEQWLFLQDVAKLIEHAKLLGYKITGGELWRTKEQQKIYYDTGKSKVKSAGYHGMRLAIDFNIFVMLPIPSTKWKLANKKESQALGDYWESLSDHNRWGGNYKSFIDAPHFERLRKPR
jgi:peptidoglycan L-alanyl-D-glutamate endopeptidase CwlK